MAESLALFGTIVAAIQLFKYGVATYEEFAHISSSTDLRARRVSLWNDQLRVLRSVTALLDCFDAPQDASVRNTIALCHEEMVSIQPLIDCMEKKKRQSKAGRIFRASKVLRKEKELEARLSSLSCLIDTLNQYALQSRLLHLTALMSTMVTEVSRIHTGQRLTDSAASSYDAEDQFVYSSQSFSAVIKLNSQALQLQSDRRLPEAEELHRICLDRYLSALGPKHRKSLQSQENLSIVLHGQGRVAEAEPLLRSAAETYETICGSTHPDTLRAWQNLACTLRDLDRYAEAEEIGTTCALRMVEIFGRAHPQTLNAFRNIAIILQYQEKFAEALEFARRVRDIYIQCVGYTSMYVDSEAVVRHVVELEEHVRWIPVNESG